MVAAGVAHLNLDVVVAVTGCFLEAESLVERVCAVVDRKDIQDQVLALLVGLVQQRGDEVSADPAPLMTRMDFDAVKIDLAGAVLDGRIHTVGGEARNAVFPNHEVYDPVADRWSVAAALPTARHGLGAAALAGRLYVIGGGPRAGFAQTDAVEVFKP